MKKEEKRKRFRQLERQVEKFLEEMRSFLDKWRPTEGRTLSSQEESDMNLDWEKIRDMRGQIDKEAKELGVISRGNGAN